VKNRILLFVLLIVFSCFAYGQKESKLKCNGYISNMQTLMFSDINKDWVNDNLIHNRLNFKWVPNTHFNTVVELRNRVFTGETVKYNPNYGNDIDYDDGIVDMSFNLFEEKSVILNSFVDRAYLSYEKGKVNVKAGRQRVNWGKCFVWNPNDIFNNYSFFDVDYIEKPGEDAIRLQYYNTEVSSSEIVVSGKRKDQGNYAGIYRFNKWEYDFQILGGFVKNEDYVLGLGWAGDIKGAGFCGELSYYHPVENVRDTTGIFLASIGTNYTFKNSLMLQFEFLYNQKRDNQTNINSFQQIINAPSNSKNLSFTEYNIFGQLSYPISPLLNGSLSVMYFPNMEGYFAGPSISYSLSDNIEFSFIVQTFGANLINEITSQKEKVSFTMSYIKLKKSF